MCNRPLCVSVFVSMVPGHVYVSGYVREHRVLMKDVPSNHNFSARHLMSAWSRIVQQPSYTVVTVDALTKRLWLFQKGCYVEFGVRKLRGLCRLYCCRNGGRCCALMINLIIFVCVVLS